MNRQQQIIASLALLVCGVLGCGTGTEATFRERESLDTLMTGMSSREDRTDENGGRIGNARAAVSNTVEEYFGTPTDLVAWNRLPIDYSTNAAGEEVGEGETLQAGRRLYMEHCMHCHGVTGDGNGPTAKYFEHPKPRDYRLGKFKFTSTKGVFKAQREDLERIIREGIPGTYMPSFLLLEDDEMHAIVEYVRWLACRGEMELQLVNSIGTQFGYNEEKFGNLTASDVEVFDPGLVTDVPDDERGEPLTGDLLKEGRIAFAREFEKFRVESGDEAGNGTMRELIDSIGEVLADGWTSAETPEAYIVPSVPRTEPTADSIARGRELYLGAKAKCVNCHGRGGKGDGPQTIAFQTNPKTNQPYDEPGLFNDWDDPIQPRNLTLGLYRGGRRPIDLFRRVHSGVKGTPMTGFAGPLTDEDIWDVVNYVMSIPYDGAEPASAGGSPEATAATDGNSGDES